MTLELLTYFVVGIAFDVLITTYSIMIIKSRWFIAGLLSTIITLIGSLVLYEIITNTNIVTNAIAYSLGCGVGTSLTVYINKRKRHEQTSSSNAD